MTVLDILGRPVERLPEGGNVEFIDEIRLRHHLHFQMGRQGLLPLHPRRRHPHPGFQVDVVDTTGCGDAYCAGFIAGLAQGWDVEKACRLATAASGLVATGLGSDAGIVDLAGTIKVMETYPK